MKFRIIFILLLSFKLCAHAQDPIEAFSEQLSEVTRRLILFQMEETDGFRIVHSAETGEKELALTFRVSHDLDYWNKEARHIYLNLLNKIKLPKEAVREIEPDIPPFAESFNLPVALQDREKMGDYFQSVILPGKHPLSAQEKGLLVKQTMATPQLYQAPKDLKFSLNSRLPAIELLEPSMNGASCQRFYLPIKTFERLQDVLNRQPRPVNLIFSLRDDSREELHSINLA